MTTEHIESGSFAENTLESLQRSELRVVSWNINRGHRFEQIREFLAAADADVILLQECDLNAIRSGSRNVARDLARELRLNYVFGVEFEELSQGNGNKPAFHGQATLSRMPLSCSRVIRFKAQSNFWKPRWFLPNISIMQRRLGGRMALVSEIKMEDSVLAVYNVHLESRSSDELRLSQTHEVLVDTRRYSSNAPLLVAGDFNCDLTENGFSDLIHNEQFENSFAEHRLSLTTRNRWLRRSRTIDWTLHRGSLMVRSAIVRSCTPGSDHFPLTLAIRFHRKVGNSPL